MATFYRLILEEFWEVVEVPDGVTLEELVEGNYSQLDSVKVSNVVDTNVLAWADDSRVIPTPAYGEGSK